MSGIATAVVAGSVITGYMGSKAQSSAASTAAGAQERSAELGIEEQRRQFDKLQEVLAPYVAAGTGGEGVQGALQAQQALLGLRGAEEQTAAIRGIEEGPLYSEMARQGEEALLQQASATGGLRGGNVQAALAQFRPQLLNQLITQQYERLGGLTNIGQSSAAGVGAAGMEQGSAIANLLAQQGAAQAGSALASGQAQAQLYSGIGQTVGSLGTLKLLGAF
jgi:hypothetical protein